MRYFTPVLVVLLLASVIANGVMYLKFRSHRPILSVNGIAMSKIELDSYLENVYGVDFKVAFVRRALIHDAAEKNSLSPSDAEVTEKYQEMKRLNLTYANTMNNNPWLADEARRAIREDIELKRLQAKDIPVTEDDVRDEYNARPALYDTPSEAETEVAVIKNGPKSDEITNQVVQLLSAQGKPIVQPGKPDIPTPGVKPSVIMGNYRGEVRFLGDNNVCTFIRHVGSQEQPFVFSMQPGEVKEVPPKQIPPELRQAGFTRMIIRVNNITPGHKADLVDPEDYEDKTGHKTSKTPKTDASVVETRREKQFRTTMELLRQNVALSRANSARELLRSLFQSAKIDAEDQSDIENVKFKLFPPEETGETPNTPRP